MAWPCPDGDLLGAIPPGAGGLTVTGQPLAELGIDRIACDGYGLCAELLPELIELDDWGYPIIRGGAIPQSVLPHARRAVSGCPTLALRLQAVASRR
jgi:ferredoxin